MFSDRPAVDVIIPTYKPDERFVRLLELLDSQTYPVAKVIIYNTEQRYFDELASRSRIPISEDRLVVKHIPFDEFDHGNTRRQAVMESDSPYFLMMTQDAIPHDERLVENLVRALECDQNVAVAYARQLPASDASITEQYVRTFNYPDKNMIKSAEDMPRLGIKTYFCSNVCALYKREVYDRLGGFVSKTIFNEDMLYAAGAIKDGQSIAYASDALVIHSHNYTGMQQLHRNFDLAVSQAQHPEVFGGVASEGEGLNLVKGCMAYLRTKHRLYLAPGFVINCGCRYLGFRLGRMYKVLPRKMVMWLTSNPAYWS